MKKLLIIILLNLMFYQISNAQKKLMRLVNSKSNKEVLINEFKRVRVKTTSDYKYSGKLRILNNEEVLVGKVMIRIDEIGKIKKNPLLLTIVTTTLTIAMGGFLVYSGVRLVLSNFPDPLAILLGAGIISLGGVVIDKGLIGPNPSLGNIKNLGWRYEIIELEE